MFNGFNLPFQMPNMNSNGDDNQPNAFPFGAFPFQMPNMNQGSDDSQPNVFSFPMQGFNPQQMNLWMLPFAQMLQMLQMAQLLQQWMLSMGMNAMNAQQQKGASIPGLNLPGLDLQKLLQMEASPKTLDGLQKVLDMVFDAYTRQQEP